MVRRATVGCPRKTFRKMHWSHLKCNRRKRKSSSRKRKEEGKKRRNWCEQKRCQLLATFALHMSVVISRGREMLPKLKNPPFGWNFTIGIQNSGTLNHHLFCFSQCCNYIYVLTFTAANAHWKQCLIWMRDINSSFGMGTMHRLWEQSRRWHSYWKSNRKKWKKHRKCFKSTSIWFDFEVRTHPKLSRNTIIWFNFVHIWIKI